MGSASKFANQLPRWSVSALGSVCLALTSVVQANADLPTVRVSEITAPSGTGAAGARWVAIEGEGNRRFVTAVFKPKGAGPFPVVVALHGASGLQDRYLEVAAELANHGFLVIAGCWQAAKVPMPICAQATPQDDWVADPAKNSGKELIAAAKHLPDARVDRIALYGMSRGGHAAIWSAASGAPVKAVVADGAAHSPAMAVPPPSTLGIVGKVSVPVLLMHGTRDNVIPVDQSRAYEKAARAARKPVVAVYFDGGGHMVSVEPATRPEAIKHAVAFLREHLR
jgi:dienelactone hydrolase